MTIKKESLTQFPLKSVVPLTPVKQTDTVLVPDGDFTETKVVLVADLDKFHTLAQHHNEPPSDLHRQDSDHVTVRSMVVSRAGRPVTRVNRLIEIMVQKAVVSGLLPKQKAQSLA